MIEELYKKICAGEEVRAGLIALKQEIQEEKGKRAFARLAAGDYTVIRTLLKAADPKIRKNAALILGEMECEEELPALWDAYRREEQLFVCPAYLKAMAAYDCSAYLPELKKRRDTLLESRQEAEKDKHIREELSALRALIGKYEKERHHTFTGLSRETDIILMTSREHREVTAEQLKDESPALLGSGVRVHTRSVDRLLQVRTWSEMLFPIRGATSLAGNCAEAGRELAASGLLSFLQSCHKGNGPFLFRAEIRGGMEPEKRAAWIKKFAASLERESGRALLNSVSDYEIEIRLIGRKDGSYLPLLKLYTIKDRRFSYRKNALPTSMQPVNAALIMELLRPYLKEGGQVLDPFCGVGTLLVERRRAMNASPLYGIDIYGEAVEMARENARLAGVPVNLINRDYLDFSHSYLFDEILADMPTTAGKKTVSELTELYQAFLKKSAALLKEDGILAVYTPEEGILLACLKQQDDFRVLKKWTIRRKEGSVLYLLGK